jgi:hypothetical protein
LEDDAVTVGALLPIYRNAEIGGSWEKRTWLDDTRERSFLTPAVIVWKAVTERMPHVLEN